MCEEIYVQAFTIQKFPINYSDWILYGFVHSLSLFVSAINVPFPHIITIQDGKILCFLDEKQKSSISFFAIFWSASDLAAHTIGDLCIYFDFILDIFSPIFRFKCFFARRASLSVQPFSIERERKWVNGISKLSMDKRRLCPLKIMKKGKLLCKFTCQLAKCVSFDIFCLCICCLYLTHYCPDRRSCRCANSFSAGLLSNNNIISCVGLMVILFIFNLIYAFDV